MDHYIIRGKRRLSGELTVQGAKNSLLPVLAAVVLTDGKSLIRNAPDLTDTESAVCILRELGCSVVRQGRDLLIDPSNLSSAEISPTLCRSMRSSVVFLGPLLARCQKAVLSLPGGCRLGERPIDLHLAGLTKMGAEILWEDDRLICTAPAGLKGAEITMPFPSVGATENLMMAAALAKGTTLLTGCAKEPEIVDLAAFLNRCGARIEGSGSTVMRITGADRLSGCAYSIMGDRIAAMTYLIAAAMTGGDLTLRGIDPRHLAKPLQKLSGTGKILSVGKDFCRIAGTVPPKSIPMIATGPYPAFPTDCLPLFLSLAAVSQGTSVFWERVFENRYASCGDLAKMGAVIYRSERAAAIRGSHLHGAAVSAQDLRGGAGLVLAALAAEGTTTVSNIAWIERGYERFCETLSDLGAEIRKE
ncbi:MAG: UDP-N-acetylglucosamine 1-carboxyvinyltransferase [Oscillospiraceae bacterium]|nr:UDP-N-acetylglucosamine 1-carboxyvinyltransferase [Oscillospiraceae bacterium]